MKIQSSDISFFSRSQSYHTTKETVYKLDTDGHILYKDQTRITTQQNTQAKARFQTGTDYTVELTDKSDNDAFQRIEKTRGSFVDLDDDFEKNMYLGSVLDWAADTIDFFVSKFKEQEENHLEKTASPDLESKDVNNREIEFYQAMAVELREKADALRPVALTLGVDRIRRTSQIEEERTVVQTMGIVHTQDGREIEFSLDIDMHHKAQTERVETFTIIDPLVINFSGTAAQLSDEKMAFDLNNDGVMENIAKLQTGSGFLALDLNEDGVINNGSELFGPSTGDGFRELSFYDDDNNQWIDENDEIFEKLAVWIKNDSQKDSLKKLSEVGIGAIHIGSVDSGFSLKSTSNETLGQVAATGIALTETGGIKTIQQIDLVV
ncbi:MAG: hypothetical protein MI862_04170 [Desulfobacterales bacterium]|nr:hypothetical protein [Desulfobacterales bacterium]